MVSSVDVDLNLDLDYDLVDDLVSLDDGPVAYVALENSDPIEADAEPSAVIEAPAPVAVTRTRPVVTQAPAPVAVTRAPSAMAQAPAPMAVTQVPYAARVPAPVAANQVAYNTPRTPAQVCDGVLANGCYLAKRRFSSANGPVLRCTILCD